MADDPFVLGGTTFTSRLIMGTGARPASTCWSGRWWLPGRS